MDERSVGAAGLAKFALRWVFALDGQRGVASTPATSTHHPSRIGALPAKADRVLLGVPEKRTPPPPDWTQIDQRSATRGRRTLGGLYWSVAGCGVASLADRRRSLDLTPARTAQLAENTAATVPTSTQTKSSA